MLRQIITSTQFLAKLHRRTAMMTVSLSFTVSVVHTADCFDMILDVLLCCQFQRLSFSHSFENLNTLHDVINYRKVCRAAKKKYRRRDKTFRVTLRSTWWWWYIWFECNVSAYDIATQTKKKSTLHNSKWCINEYVQIGLLYRSDITFRFPSEKL